MRTPRVTFISLLVVVLALTVPHHQASAEAVEPNLTIVKAETVPGIMTRMQIEWTYLGPQPDVLQFRLSRISSDMEESEEIALLDVDARQYEYDLGIDALTLDFRLDVLQGD